MANDVAFALLDATRRMSISRGRTDSFGSSIGHDDHTISTSLGSSTGGGWFDKWKSNTELDANTDSLHSLPKDTGSWFPVQRNSGPGEGFLIIPDIIVETVHGIRHRAYSESASEQTVSHGRSRLGSINGRGWFAPGPGFTARKVSEMGTATAAGFGERVRHENSHKEVEEALAGGLNKVDMFMPSI